jgi:hypothetical protein
MGLGLDEQRRADYEIAARPYGSVGMMPWLAKTAFGASLPTPVTRVNFEVSRKGSAAVIDFRIKQRRPYFIALQFNYVGRADSDRVVGLVEYPGITIPIHLRLLIGRTRWCIDIGLRRYGYDERLLRAWVR